MLYFPNLKEPQAMRLIYYIHLHNQTSLREEHDSARRGNPLRS